MTRETLPLLVAVAVSALLVFAVSTESKRAQDKVIGLTAICADGMLSTSKRGPGVCAGHGGVERWAEK